MFHAFRGVSVLIGFLASTIAAAETLPKVDADLAEYDAAVQKLQDGFAKMPGDSSDKAWVKKKLQHMVEIDQYMRKFSGVAQDRQYTKAEQEYFFKEFIPRWLKLDQQNTADLKTLLEKHSWFTVSEWGKAADNNAWLLVQHADQDRDFQKEILAKLEKLYPTGDTDPSNYAYLYDRVAGSFHDPAKRQLQRYGTQGHCVEPGKWEPFPIEDEANVDLRRAEVGLPPLSEYVAGFKDICK